MHPRPEEKDSRDTDVEGMSRRKTYDRRVNSIERGVLDGDEHGGDSKSVS